MAAGSAHGEVLVEQAFLALSGFLGRATQIHFWLVFVVGVTFALESCNLTGNDVSSSLNSAPVSKVQSEPLAGAPAAGELVGGGPVRVGVILPLTQNGAASVIGQSLRNAAQLAVDESGSNAIALVINDDHSTPEGAAQAAQNEVDSGAEIIVGPLFASSVREVGRVAKAANIPVIAFSTDESVASRGVYLLSFLIESYVDGIVDFAMGRGLKSYAVLAPQNDYANIATAEFQTVAAKLNAQVVTIARYTPGQPESGVQEIAGVANQIDGLFIPEQADGAVAVGAALAARGIKAQVLGTGVWNDARVLQLPAFQGAWFAAPENAGFAAFAQRYRAKFNSDPTRLATLAYDAVSLVVALSKTQGAQRFSESALANPSGYNGADGVFRFRSDGRNERGLAVLQIEHGSTSVLRPAPHSFAGG
jgi:branched-chain amino acid transport system substrate-binding protein